MSQSPKERSQSPEESKKRKRSPSPEDSAPNKEAKFDTTNKVVVRNLSYDAEYRDLRDMFEKCGEIEDLNMPTHHDKSKGFAFITFKTKEAFDEAIKKYDQTDHMGRTIKVEAARERGKGAENTQIHIGNISYDSTEESIKDFFKKCGTIKDVRVPRYHDGNKPKGFAFVEFETEEAVNKALDMDKEILDGRDIRVSVAERRRKRFRGGDRYDRGYGGHRDRYDRYEKYDRHDKYDKYDRYESRGGRGYDRRESYGSRHYDDDGYNGGSYSSKKDYDYDGKSHGGSYGYDKGDRSPRRY